MREFANGQKLFRRYTLKRTLGRGGMGVVWLARDDELERDVALKFLPELIIHDRAVLGDLKRETRRSLELTHKNIVRIYDFVHDETSGCISMEYVDGDTLSNLRADKPHKVFEPDEVKEWISQLCDALDYAHNHAKIVHRDLKPANLMVNQRGDLKVADFGIARSLSDSMSVLTMERGKSGTLLYMSPQQLDGDRGSHLDDIYSLGAAIYELLTSKPPFYSGNVDRQIREKTAASMTQRRQELEVEMGPVEETWEEVVSRCLAKDPAKRPQSVSEVAKMLAVPSPKTRRARGTAAAAAPMNWKPIAIAAIALLVLGIGGWVAYRATQKPATERPSAPVATAATAVPAPPAPSTTPVPAPVPVVINSTIAINSSPAGATVFVDGRDSGKTPLTLRDIAPGTVKLRMLLDGYEVVERSIPVKQNQPVELGTITLKPNKPPEVAVPTPKLLPNAVYAGTIHEKGQSADKYNVPLTIAPAADIRSGTMTQTSRKGDMVVKYSGVWEGTTLRAVTNQVVSKPTGLQWQPESFTLQLSEDGRSANYECNADGRTYVAELSARTLGANSRLSALYQGTITGGTPLSIAFAADRKSGTMTQSARSGDLVVKFSGIWEDNILRAVTGEVVSKPAKIQWQPESFTLRFDASGKHGTYECLSEGKMYSADLAAP
jgi:hypothetical protein